MRYEADTQNYTVHKDGIERIGNGNHRQTVIGFGDFLPAMNSVKRCLTAIRGQLKQNSNCNLSDLAHQRTKFPGETRVADNPPMSITIGRLHSQARSGGVQA